MEASNKRRKTLIINACPWAHRPPVQGKVSQGLNNALAIVCGRDRLHNKIRTWAAVPEACSAVLVGHNRVSAPLLGGLGSSGGGGSQDNSDWPGEELSFLPLHCKGHRSAAPAWEPAFLCCALCCAERGKAAPSLAPGPAHQGCTASPHPPSQNLTQHRTSSSQTLLRRVLTLTDKLSVWKKGAKGSGMVCNPSSQKVRRKGYCVLASLCFWINTLAKSNLEKEMVCLVFWFMLPGHNLSLR